MKSQAYCIMTHLLSCFESTDRYLKRKWYLVIHTGFGTVQILISTWNLVPFLVLYPLYNNTIVILAVKTIPSFLIS